MTTFLTVLLVLACVLLVVAVLLQPAKGGTSVLGGSSNSVFGSSGGTTALFRLSMGLGAFIMIVSLVLSRYQVTDVKSSTLDLSAPSSADPLAPLPTAVPPQTELPPGSAPSTAPAAPSNTPSN